MSAQSKTMVHQCGRRVEVELIPSDPLPRFIVGLLQREICPRCSRNLVNDWLDEPWRFWTTRAWVKLSTWRNAIRGLGDNPA
ncbi:MAG: hypothetical protein RRC07_04615 [Anaerolineae bacterium]|nr:hypothetical protein [Anaerolineae bacterium]